MGPGARSPPERRDGVTSGADTRTANTETLLQDYVSCTGVGWGGGRGMVGGGWGGVAVYEGVPAMLSYSGATGPPRGFRVSVSHTDLI